MARNATVPTPSQRRRAGRDRRRPRRRRRSRRRAPGSAPNRSDEPAADRPHDDRDHHEAGHPVGRVGRGEAVGGLEVGGQVDRERDVATEGDRVEDAGLPGDRQPGVGREPADQGRRRARPGPGRRAGPARRRRRSTASTPAVIRNGAFAPRLVKSLTVVRALIAVPPMPAPKMPIARPRRLRREPGVDERDADGERRTGDAEEEPADQQQGVGVEGEEGDEQDRHDGRRAETIGNITRPPYRSVSATDDDAAQRADDHRDRDQQRDVGLAERPERARGRGTADPSGLISAHAQKLTANPIVAMRQHQPRRARLRRARRRVEAHRRHLVLLHRITFRKGRPSPPWQRAGTCGTRRPRGPGQSRLATAF